MGIAEIYSGFEVNPDTIRKVRSAVRVLREVGATVGLSGNIAVHGFSRGATAGSMAAGDLADPEIDSAGYSTALSSRVQTVLLGSGIYDYSHSGGTTTGDPAGTEADIYDRFVTAWGATAPNLDFWQKEGALYYMSTAATAPTFLSYNTDDAAYYVYQAQLMEAKLTILGVAHQVATGTGAHHVTTNSPTLTAIYDFFEAHSNPQPNKPGATILSNYDTNANKLDLTINANGNGGAVRYAIYTDGAPRKWVQVDGSVNDQPIWQTLSDWGTQVRVGPLTNLDTVRFTVVAYDPTNFTTAQNSEDLVGPASLPAIGNIRVAPLTGEVSFTWPASGGVTNPADLNETVERSTNLENDWTTVPGAVITITNGTATLKDSRSPADRSFYRLARP